MTGPYTWDKRAGQYRDASGRFVPRIDIREAVDWAIDNAQRRILATGEDFRAGRITLEQWREQTARDLKDVHLYSGAAARGGWAQMTQSDFGLVGAELRRQYAYLDNFAQQIANGTQKLDGAFVNRLRLYAQSGRLTYARIDLRVNAALGMDEERNVLHPADHCEECQFLRDLGWVPIGTLPPIGERECLTNCRCTISYRRAR